MTKQKPTRKKSVKKSPTRTFSWATLAVPALVVLVLIIGSFSFAASKEENNSFCASCHTQPETTFYQRSLASAPADLATFHNSKDVKCIDCHSGPGAFGRVGAIMLGSRNALAYFTHTATQPAPLTIPISDNNCLKCHENVLTGQANMENHFHIFLLRWQAADPNAAGCVSCHSSHSTDGQAQIGFLNQQQTEQICQQCHSVLRE